MKYTYIQTKDYRVQEKVSGLLCSGVLVLLFILPDADFNIFTLGGQVSRKSLLPRNNL